jgi:hypothetical protein
MQQWKLDGLTIARCLVMGTQTGKGTDFCSSVRELATGCLCLLVDLIEILDDGHREMVDDGVQSDPRF